MSLQIMSFKIIFQILICHYTHSKSNYHLNPLKLYTYNPENLSLMRNQQLGNMAAKVEMVHVIHNALVLCVTDLWGEVIYHMKLEVLESN